MNDPLPALSERPTSVPGRAVSAWDWFWFNKADPLPLGVIRFFAGLVIFYIHLAYTPQLLNFVGPDAWISGHHMNRMRHTTAFVPPSFAFDEHRDYNLEQPYARGYYTFSVWFHVHDPGWIVTIHLLFLAAMALFTVGFCTRVTGVITWLAMLSYIHRGPTSLFGMDTVTNLTVIYLVLGPSGVTFSVDRVIQKWWAQRRGLPEPEVEPRASANFALRLMQVHFCIIYTASGLSKLQGSAWWNGSAMWGTLANYEFSPMNWDFYTRMLAWLCESRLVWEAFGILGCLYTLVVEICFVFGIWSRRTRWLFMTGAIVLHIGIGLLMGLTTFSLIMLCLLLSFMPPETIHEVFARLKARGRGMSTSTTGETRSEPEPLLALHR